MHSPVTNICVWWNASRVPTIRVRREAVVSVIRSFANNISETGSKTSWWCMGPLRPTQCGERQHQPLWLEVSPWQISSVLLIGAESPRSDGSITERPRPLNMCPRSSKGVDTPDTTDTGQNWLPFCATRSLVILSLVRFLMLHAHFGL